jgi:replicative DNA helicase
MRPLPADLNAEKALLGSMLMDPAVVDATAGLPAAAWILPQHAALHHVLLDMRTSTTGIDPITVTAAVRSVEGITNPELFVTELATIVPTAANWEYYLQLVVATATQRRIIAACTKLVSAAYEHQGPIEQLLNDTEEAMFSLRMEGAKNNDALRPVREFVQEAIDGLDAVHKARGKTVGLPTGFADIDRMTSGMKPCSLWVVAGRPSMGKTVLGMQIATKTALNGISVAVYSLEMSGGELAERMLGTQASINLQRWRDGFLEKNDMPKLHNAATEIAKAPLYIDETPSLSILDLRARARMAKANWGVRVIVVDYLQLMRSTSRRAESNRAMEIAEISQGLKAMAKELRVTVIACAQLNRDAEDRKRPALRDLRESGQIEQDADIAILLHRPFKDKEKTPDDIAEFTTNGEPAEAIIAKQRNGPTGPVNLRFFGQFTRFESETKKLYSNNEDERQ